MHRIIEETQTFEATFCSFQLGPKSSIFHAQKPFAYRWNPHNMPQSNIAVEIKLNAKKWVKNYEESLKWIFTG